MLPAHRPSLTTVLHEWHHRTFQGALAGVAWMIVACLLFSILGMIIKFSKGYFSLSEILFYRNLPTVLILGMLMPARGHSLKTLCFFHQWQRATLGSIAMTLNFCANMTLPLALAMTLSYTNPVFLALITILWFKRPLGKGLISCLIMGTCGVIILLRPNGLSDGNWLGGLAGLGSGFFAALAYLNIQALSQKGEPEWRTVFYFALFGTLYALATALVLNEPFHALTLTHIALIAGLGLSGLGGQLCITRAFSQGQPNVTSIFSYSSLLFSSLWGWLFFQEQLDAFSIIGGITVLCSGVLATWLKRPSSTAAPT